MRSPSPSPHPCLSRCRLSPSSPLPHLRSARPPPSGRASTWLQAGSTALTGSLLMRSMWIEDYVAMGTLAVLFALNLYLLWHVMQDRE